jgi:hypothetical protein
MGQGLVSRPSFIAVSRRIIPCFFEQGIDL